jgi:hypothetical protein
MSRGKLKSTSCASSPSLGRQAAGEAPTSQHKALGQRHFGDYRPRLSALCETREPAAAPHSNVVKAQHSVLAVFHSDNVTSAAAKRGRCRARANVKRPTERLVLNLDESRSPRGR